MQGMLEQERHADCSSLEVFTQPFLSPDEEDAALQQFALEVPQRFQNVLVIGRFQPLHRGHIHLLKQALAISQKVTIGIGSANTIDEDNPFSASQRKQMLIHSLQRENLLERVSNIVCVNDYLADDSVWFRNTVQIAGQVDGVVGNNDWVNGIFRNNGLPAITTPLLQRGVYEGRKIRALLRFQGKL